MKNQTTGLKWGLIGLGTIAIVAAGTQSLRTFRSTEPNALFEGPFEVCEREKPAYYPRVDYQTSAYSAPQDHQTRQSTQDSSKFTTQSNEDEILYVDGAGRNEIEAAMQKNVGQMKESLALTRLRYASSYKDRQPHKVLQIVSPENGTLFPPNLCAPFITWEDPRNDLWQVSLRSGDDSKAQTFVASERRWRFPKKIWKRISEESLERDTIIQIKGIQLDEEKQRNGNIQASTPIRFRISKDPADNFIVYRLVAPPFSAYKTPDIYCRDIREDKPVSFLSAQRQYCLNCHNFSSKQGNQGKLALQVRSLVKVANNLPTYLAIYDIDKQQGFKVRLPFEIQMTTFMGWSRDGKKLAYSANQKVAAMKPIVFETQLAGMATSDIAVYDIDKNETRLVPGASDPNLLEVYPEWSPDGKQLIFARGPVGQHPAHIHYNLCAVDVDAGDNPEIRLLEGASKNEKSNYYPHFSPDGQWLSFCQSDGGDLIRSSSDMYLKKGNLLGPSHYLESNAEHAADSWHSWSSNSRWLVFASKRGSGVYAYLYMTHIDENGHASPAVPLPVLERPMASFNIPEFVANLPDIREDKLYDAIRVEPKPRVVREIKPGQECKNGQESENVQEETSE